MAVTMIEVRHHLRVTNPHEDDLIKKLIDVSLEFIEKKVDVDEIDDAVVDQAVLLVASFLYTHRGDPLMENRPPTPNAWRSSGAASLLSPWTKTGSAIV